MLGYFLKIIDLKLKIDLALDEGEDTSKLESAKESLEFDLHKVRSGQKKKYRERLRELYDTIYWISKKSSDDKSKSARARQIKELRALAKEKDFAISYELVESDPAIAWNEVMIPMTVPNNPT